MPYTDTPKKTIIAMIFSILFFPKRFFNKYLLYARCIHKAEAGSITPV